MKHTIKVEKEVNIKYLVVDVPVRYDEDDMPNDFQFRQGNQWNVKIDIDTGCILGWKKSEPHSFCMKVTDSGRYTLLDENNEILAVREDCVPDNLIPGSYGDYIEFNIDENGKITNWYNSPEFDQFFKDED